MSPPDHKDKQRQHLQEAGAESTWPSSPSREHGDTVAKEQSSEEAEILMKPLQRSALTQPLDYL